MVSWKRPFGPHCAVTHIVASKLPRMVGSVRAVLRAHQSTRALRRGALFCQFACFPWPRAAVPAKAWEFHSLVPSGGSRICSLGGSSPFFFLQPPLSSSSLLSFPFFSLLLACTFHGVSGGRGGLSPPCPHARSAPACARWFCPYPRLWPSFQLDSIIQKIST